MEQIDRVTGEVSSGVPPSIAQAIIAVKKQVRQLGSDERNEHAKYAYVSVDKFYERVGPMMATAGLALLIDETSSGIEILESTDRDGNLRKVPWLFAHYALSFMHEDGSVSAPMRRSLAMPINGPQTYGAAQSYIEKQFLRQVFKIPTGEKDADETAQGDDAPSGGRRAPQVNSGARSYPQRQQAAPAPSDAAAEATKRWREIARDIDGMEDAEMLQRLEEWPAFRALDKISAEASGSPAEHKENMDMLRVRAASRRRRLVGDLKEFDL